ncbi:MAG: sporulation protein YqfD [Clostridia bacterium]
MQKYNNFRGNLGKVRVKIEGYFIERFVNLCSIQGIEIWNLVNKDSANVELDIRIKDFKKLKSIARKTKCKIKIISKSGCYFIIHKYRKRKVLLFSIIFSIFISIYASTLVWKIEINGLETIPKYQVEKSLKTAGVYKGKSRFFIKPKKAVFQIRDDIQKVAWTTVKIRGSRIEVEVKERKSEIIPSDDKTPTHIIATKSGIITKIISENGSTIIDEGKYIEKGQIAICGIIEGNKTKVPILVNANGIVRANIEYEDTEEMLLVQKNRKYTGRKYYLLGFAINNKEIVLNYLIKNKKYDISKRGNSINLNGNILKLNHIIAKEYKEVEVSYTKEQAKQILQARLEEKMSKKIIKDINFVDKKITFEEKENKIIAKMKYVLNEEIGKKIIFSTAE